MAKLMRPGEVTLITGGARSGKSRLAEAIIAHENQAAIYVATAEVRDDEMATRVTEHQDRRGPRAASVSNRRGGARVGQAVLPPPPSCSGSDSCAAFTPGNDSPGRTEFRCG